MSRLPDHWSKSTVGELAASIQYGYTASARSDVDGPRFLRITDIQDGQVDWASVPSCQIEGSDFEKYQLHDGDIVFARTGATTGKSYLIKNVPPAVFASYLIRLRMAAALDPAYLAYFFQTVDYWRQIERGKRGIGQPNVNAKTLSHIVVPVAPPDQQGQIVAKIDELFSDLDAGVAALRRAQANLKRYRAVVLKAAVEGKLTEQWRAENPSSEPASVLLERILVERRKKWEEEQLKKYEAKGKKPSENWREKYKEPPAPETAQLAKLPKGWCWATAAQAAEIQGGIQKQPKRAPKENAYPYLRVANVLRDRLDLGVVHRFELFDNELPKLRLKVGDLLVVEGNGSQTEIGRSALWRGEIEDCVHQNHIIRVRFNAGIPEFLNYYWNSPPGAGRVINQAASTSGLYTLSVSKVSNIPIPIPPVSEQQEIAGVVEALLSVQQEVTLELQKNVVRSARLRQGILKQAFHGNLVRSSYDDSDSALESTPSVVDAQAELSLK